MNVVVQAPSGILVHFPPFIQVNYSLDLSHIGVSDYFPCKWVMFNIDSRYDFNLLYRKDTIIVVSYTEYSLLEAEILQLKRSHLPGVYYEIDYPSHESKILIRDLSSIKDDGFYKYTMIHKDDLFEAGVYKDWLTSENPQEWYPIATNKTIFSTWFS